MLTINILSYKVILAYEARRPPNHKSIDDQCLGMTRERVRRIIEGKFIQRLPEEDKDTLCEIENVIQQYPLVWVEGLKVIMRKGSQIPELTTRDF